MDLKVGLWRKLSAKEWCFWTVVLEKTLESPLDCKEIQPLHPKGNQSWIFIGRTDAEGEAPILWPPDAKKWLIGKDLDARKDWRREKGMTGWDGWMVSPTRWTWIWVNFGSWWWTGKPGMLQSMGSQRELDHKEDWAPMNGCFWTVVLEKTLESPLDCKEIQLVHPKGNQSWIFIGKTDAEAEAPILWPPDAKSQLIEKDPDAG